MHYFLYWLQHYQDYSWDNTGNYFKNQKEKAEENESDDRLFNKLFQSNDKNTLNIYASLIRQNAEHIEIRCTPYHHVLFLPNRDLPAFPFISLEKLSQLNEYCEKTSMPFIPSPQLENELDKLKNKLRSSQRYALENALIASLKPEEITGVEYWGILNQNINWETSISIGRILDKYYSKNWEQIIHNKKYLKLYLKKAILFSQLKLKGYCNDYLNKFKGMDDSLKQKLSDLLEVEDDQDIRQAVVFLTGESEIALQEDLKQFLLYPTEKSFEKIRKTTLHNEKDFSYITERIKELKDVEKIKLLFVYLEQNPAIEQVPSLVSLLSDQRVLDKRDFGKQVLYYTVADYAVAQMERIYKHSFADEKDFYKIKKTNTYIFKKTSSHWLAYWNEKGADYKNWEKVFFEQKINLLMNQPTINLINNIYYSPFFSKDVHEQILWAAFPKIKPQAELIYWPFKENISPEIWLKIEPYINDAISFAHFVAQLQTDKPESFMEKLIAKMSVLDLYHRGEIYYQLFLKGNLREWFSKYTLEKYAPPIKEALQTFANATDAYELEYLMIQRYIFFLENLHKTISQQFTKALLITRKDLKLEILEDILINSSYENLREIWSNVKNLNTNNHSDLLRSQLMQYIQEDLGILSDDMGDNSIDDMMIMHRQLSEKEFYRYYIRKAGLDIFDESGNLIYKTIYDVLKYDVCTDFAGLLPSVRAGQVFMVIRLLELEFDTRLGFPANLYHTYSFVFRQNIRQRVARWMQFLEEKELVERDGKEARGFEGVE